LIVWVSNYIFMPRERFQPDYGPDSGGGENGEDEPAVHEDMTERRNRPRREAAPEVVEVDESVIKRATKRARDAADKVEETVFKTKKWEKAGQIFGVSEGGFVIDVDGDLIDLRDEVAFGDDVEIAYGDKFGYNHETEKLEVTADMMNNPSAPLKVFREIIRQTADDYSENEEKISAERKAREKLAKDRKKHEDTYLWWSGDINQAQYEQAEREASALRVEAEKALDQELKEHLKEFKEKHGIDLEQLEGGDKIRDEIEAELKEKQQELVFPFDEKGKGYLTGEKPKFWERFKGNNEVMQDYRFRRTIKKVPINRKWANRMYGGGIIVAGAASVALKPVRNFVRNRLWGLEKRIWKKTRASFFGVIGGAAELGHTLMDLLGDWGRQGRENNLFKSFGVMGAFDKTAKKNLGRAEKIKGEPIPKPPWVVAHEEVVKYANKDSKSKKGKKKSEKKGGKKSESKKPDDKAA